MTSELRLDISALDNASRVFVDLAKTVEKLERKLAELDKKSASPEIDVDTRKAEAKVGAFAKDVRKRLDAALKSLPDIELDADASDAQRELAGVRKDLAELSGKSIGVDIDAGEALRQADELKQRLDRLNREGVDIGVRVDAASAAAALYDITRQVERLDGAAAKVNVDADTAQAERNVGSFASTMQTRLTAAVKAIPDIQLGADATPAEQALDRIRGDLATLSGKRIGVDIDAAAAYAETQRLRTELERLERTTPNVQVRADALAALAQLNEVDRAIKKVDGKRADAKVDVDTSAAFTAMTRLGQVMGGLALGGGVLAAIPQLASLASAAVAAAGAMGAIPAAIGAGGAAFGAVKIGLTGLSDAFDAMGKSSTSSGGAASSAASQHEAAAQRIQSAEQSLADAREQAGRSAIQSAQAVAAAQQGVADAIEEADRRAADSARQVAQAQAAVGDAVESAARREESAEASVERAQVSARDAQEALNRARVDAKEKIEDMALALSGAALDEESAQIRLARAQERLQKLSRTGGSALDFQEANLGVKEAQQSLLEVRERYGDIKKEAADTNAKGVEGADNVVAAQRRVQDANQGVTDAERQLQQTREDGAKSIAAAQDRLTQAQEAQRRSAEDSARSIARAEDGLAKARQQQAWQQEDSAKAIARAQQQVAEAVKSASDSAGSGSSKVNAYADALAKLSPNARAFVEQVKALKPRWDELTRAVQNNLFAGVAEQTKTLADQYLPRLQGMFTGIATSANRGAIEVAKFFQQGDTSSALQASFDDIGRALDIAAGAAKPLTQAVTDLFTSGTRFLPGLAQDFKDLADRVAEFVRNARDNGDLGRWIQTGIDKVEEFGKLFWNIGGIIAEVFKQADGSGVDFLGTLVDLTGKVKEFLRSPEGNDLLTRVFDSIKQTVDNLKPGLTAVWDTIKDVIREIAPKTPGVADDFSRLAEKLAPILGDVTVAVFDALKFAFDVLSRVPAPVLVALAGVFIAIRGIQAARSGLDSAMTLIGAFRQGGTFRNFIGDLDTIIKRLTGKGGVSEGLDEVNSKAGGDEPGSTGGKKRSRVGRVARGAGRALGAAGGAYAIGATLEGVAGEDPGADFNKDFGSRASDAADTAGRLLTFDFGGIIDKFRRDIKAFPEQWDAAMKDISGGWDRLWGGAETVWNGFTGWVKQEWPGFSADWDGFWSGLNTSASGSFDLTGWISQKWSEFTTWWDSESPNFQIDWTGLWDGLHTAATDAFGAIGIDLPGKWSDFRGWWDGASADWSTGWDAFWNTDIGQKVSDAMDGITTSVSTKWGELTAWWSGDQDTQKTNWSGFWDANSLKTSLSMDGIRGWVHDKWTELWQWWDGDKNTRQTNWAIHWDTLELKAGMFGEGFKTKIRNAVDWVRINVWDPMNVFVTQTIPGSFDRAVQAIDRAWSRLHDIAAVPVRFMVGTVYNGGIVPAWNGLAGIVNLPKLGPVPVNFAAGGVVAGVDKGYDYIPAMLRGGEGVLVPQAVRMFGGKAGIDAINRRAEVQHFADGGVAGFSGSGGATATVNRATGSVQGTSLLMRLFTDPAAAARDAFSSIAGRAGNTPGVGLWRNAVAGLPGKLVDAAISKIKAAAASLVVTSAAPAGAGVQRWAPVVLQALGMMGQPASLLQTVLSRMQRESGGNPRAINLWDSNALRGDPSRGLMQTIMSTFRAYHFPGTSNDIFDPLANILASMKYAVARYGSLAAAYNKAGGYDRGGVATGAGFLAKATVSPERVLSPQQTASFDRLVASLDSTGRVRGSDGGSLLDLNPVVGQLRALRGDVDQGGYFGALIGEVRALRQELARTGGNSAAASAQAARTAAELGAF